MNAKNDSKKGRLKIKGKTVNKMKKQKRVWDEFTNKYSLTKTLRFELKPVGKTIKHINKNRFIEKDEQKEKEFNQVKKIMDEFYKYFIEKSLNDLKIDTSELESFEKTYTALKVDRNNDSLRKEYAKTQTKIRKSVYGQIKKTDDFDKIFKKEFVDDILPNWLDERGEHENS